MKAIKVAGLAIAALVAACLLLLFIGIPLGFLTPTIEQKAEQQTGYRVTIAGTTRFTLWPTSLTLNDVTVQDPNERDPGNRLNIGSARADLSLASLFAGRPQVTDLEIIRPQLHVPLLRERTRASAPSSPQASVRTTIPESAGVEHISITDGEVIFANPSDHVEQRVTGIAAEIKFGVDRQIKIVASARASDRPIKLSLSAAAPAAANTRQNIPVELTLDAPGFLTSTLTSKAEVRINGGTLMINGLSGALGDAQFNGWASADLSSKPLVKLDLDFQRLDLGTRSPSQTDPGLATQPWSDTPFDLMGLNYLDAQIRVSAAEFNVGDAHFAPASIDAALSNGALKAAFANLGAYGGTANGEANLDVSSGIPAIALRTDLVGVRALPLLSALADFDRLDGKLQAKVAVRATGNTQRAMMSSLSGTASVDFRDGAIRGLNLAKMIRALTSGTLTGWQSGPDQATDLSQLSASFAIDKGQATTSDLALAGPLVRMTGGGRIDLATKALALRVDPKLVMTTEGQGGASNPVGFGIPVVIDGPWAEPRIYPEVAGILDNPDAAYAKLRELGKGLFGADGLSSPLSGPWGETLGTMIQQGLGGARRNDPSAPDGGARPAAPTGPSPVDGILKQLFGR